VPTEVAALVRKLMAKRPEDRYHSAVAVAEELGAWLAGGRPAAPAGDRGITAAVARQAGSPAGPFAAIATSDTELAADSPRLLRRLAERRRLLLLNAAGAVALAGMVALLVVLVRQIVQPPPPQPESGSSPAEAALEQLRREVESGEAERRWQEAVDFRAAHPGTPEALEAAGLLGRLPSPLDRLDPKLIPAHDLYPDWQPKGLVAVIGEHAGRL
jgi:hypothetical protein